ncbi:MAG: hypothetical protein IJN67_14165 [Oscillospiraceae bacterium]|nr:hypothetical protein [Oscillospiraceae bacterium]
MSYIRAENILPEELVRAIWQYVDGVYLYIPRNPEKRRLWGQNTAYRQELEARNRSIREDAARGVRVSVLCERYHLSEKSIRRILQK